MKLNHWVLSHVYLSAGADHCFFSTHGVKGLSQPFNSMSDQDRISPYNINAI